VSCRLVRTYAIPSQIAGAKLAERFEYRLFLGNAYCAPN
jgi:hypothetical protein